MPTSFSHIVLCLFTFPLLLLQLLQNCYRYFCHCYHYYHTTLLLNTLLQILSYPGVVELTTQRLILENILWLPLCRINKFGLNTLRSKTVVIPYTCGLSLGPAMCWRIIGMSPLMDGWHLAHWRVTSWQVFPPANQNFTRGNFPLVPAINGLSDPKPDPIA